MQNFDLMTILFKLAMFFVPFLFALCFHEFAHGLVAKWLGDRTAERAGRLSLNPFVHADPLGTFILPISAIVLSSPFFFGWAKPVPVDSRNLRRPRQDMFWVALAGPASNVFLAVVGSVVLAFALVRGQDTSSAEAIRTLLQTFISVNLFLAVFNLIPIHPLDGGKVIEPFLPASWNIWLERNQSALSMGLFVGFLLIGNLLALPVTWLTQIFLHASIHLATLLA